MWPEEIAENPMPKAKKARAVGFNHIALEVGDIEEALAFYGQLFDFKLRGKSVDSAFLDPWGNRIEIVGYDNIQFTKAAHVLRSMGLSHLSKSEKAIKELADKGMAPS
jgi:catechol 2,3-dioxygenase-like lactoylglutathione lyase family enzyme